MRGSLLAAQGNRILFNAFHLAHPHFMSSIIYSIDLKQSHRLQSGWSNTELSFNALLISDSACDAQNKSAAEGSASCCPSDADRKSP